MFKSQNTEKNQEPAQHTDEPVLATLSKPSDEVQGQMSRKEKSLGLTVQFQVIKGATGSMATADRGFFRELKSSEFCLHVRVGKVAVFICTGSPRMLTAFPLQSSAFFSRLFWLGLKMSSVREQLPSIQNALNLSLNNEVNRKQMVGWLVAVSQ